MRLSLGLSPLGIALSLAIAWPCAEGSFGRAEAQTVVAQNAAGKRKGPVKRAAPAAQAKDGAADGKAARAPAEIDRQLDGAAKSLAAGDADTAMATLDGVLTGGGLANKHMARALYLRGVAHRKKGRPAQAIADLTSAVWLKDGLGEADRAAALKERGEVSREVGVAQPASPGEAPASRREATAQTAPQTPPQPTTSLLTAPSASSPFPVTGFPETAEPRRRVPRDSAGSSQGSAPAAGQTASKGAGPATSSWESKTEVEAKVARAPESPRPRAGAPLQAPITDAPVSRPQSASPPSSSGEGIGQFFTGLFGGGSSAPAKPSKGESWSTSTSADGQVRRKRAPEPGEIATSAVPPPSKAAAPDGAYRLQIAIVRSRSEAEAVAARTRKEHSGIIGAHRLDVDETVYGSMGTFFRVRLGPFASPHEPRAVCDKLRPKGYDCVVVTN